MVKKIHHSGKGENKIMKNGIEIRWHGRGGQGAKTAALLLADVAFKTGRNVQGFPEYGQSVWALRLQHITGLVLIKSEFILIYTILILL